MIPPIEQVEAVCEGLRSTFPDARIDSPHVPEDYFDHITDVAIIRSRRLCLSISEECFDYHDPTAIVEALTSLKYADLLAEHRRLFLGCAPHRARRDLPIVIRWKDWYLVAGSD